MARGSRVHYEGAVYHITARGNKRNVIFHDDQDKAKYLKLINHYKEKFAFHLYAYAIMDNHIHILLEVDINPLSQIMQGLQQSYTLYYNYKYKTVGHVFQQRYLAKLCNKDNYLLAIVKYIHYNPIKAGISKSLHYEWTSHCRYLGQHSTIDTDFILGLFFEEKAEALFRYRRFMEDNEIKPVIPDTAYIETKSVQNVVDYGKINVSDLLNHICEVLDISAEDVCGSRRSGDIVKARKILIYLALKNNILNKELASLLSVNPSSVTRAFNSVLQDQAVKAEAEKLSRCYRFKMQ